MSPRKFSNLWVVASRSIGDLKRYLRMRMSIEFCAIRVIRPRAFDSSGLTAADVIRSGATGNCFPVTDGYSM